MVGQAGCSRKVGCSKECLLCFWRVSGSCEWIAQRQEKLASRERVERLSQVERLQRELVEARRLLVGEELESSSTSASRVVERLLDVSAGRGLEEVIRELGEVGLGIPLVQAFECFARTSMELSAPHRGQLVVERLADQGVSEAEMTVCSRNRRQHLRGDRFIEDIEELVRAQFTQVLESVELELTSEHRCER